MSDESRQSIERGVDVGDFVPGHLQTTCTHTILGYPEVLARQSQMNVPFQATPSDVHLDSAADWT